MRHLSYLSAGIKLLGCVCGLPPVLASTSVMHLLCTWCSVKARLPTEAVPASVCGNRNTVCSSILKPGFGDTAVNLPMPDHGLKAVERCWARVTGRMLQPSSCAPAPFRRRDQSCCSPGGWEALGVAQWEDSQLCSQYSSPFPATASLASPFTGKHKHLRV